MPSFFEKLRNSMGVEEKEVDKEELEERVLINVRQLVLPWHF